MFCTACGEEIAAAGARFCGACGAPVAGGAAQQEASFTADVAVPYAGFWARAAACLIDLPVVLFLAWIAKWPPLLLWEGVLEGKVDRILFDDDDTMMQFFAALIALVLMWLYCALAESSRKQGTLGKIAMGLVVTDLRGRRVSFGRASGRYIGKYLSATMLGIGFLVAAFSERRQALHDSVAGCLVLRRRGSAPAAWDPAAPDPRPPGRAPATGADARSSKKLAVASLLLGLASIPLPYVGLPLGVAGIIFATLQRPPRRDVLSLTGLLASIVGAAVWGGATLLFLFLAATT